MSWIAKSSRLCHEPSFIISKNSSLINVLIFLLNFEIFIVRRTIDIVKGGIDYIFLTLFFIEHTLDCYIPESYILLLYRCYLLLYKSNVHNSIFARGFIWRRELPQRVHSSALNHRGLVSDGTAKKIRKQHH